MAKARMQSSLRDLLTEHHNFDHREFAGVVDLFSIGYGRLAQKGIGDLFVAHAMLGAMLNLYDLFAFGPELPHFFRELADHIENDVSWPPHQGEA